MKYFWSTLVLCVFITACQTSRSSLPGGLSLEEHALSQAPASDLFSFQPVEGTQEKILALHADERKQVIPMSVITIENNPALKASWGGSDLIATVFTDAENQPEQIVKVSSQGDTLLTTSAGMPSPVMPLQGLWTYGRHWALEILYATPEVWTGQIFIDGILTNEDKNYDEAFGFQMLADKPFFFYQRNGIIGISYDGQEAELGYTSIPHYLCCAESILNPIPAENMVAFFAQRNETWYYVELGDFR
jgi:hypothetical protein